MGRFCALALAGLLFLGAGWPSHERDRSPRLHVIVRAQSVRTASAAVESVGGRVTASLPIVNGVAATVPASVLSELAATGGVTAITPNERVAYQGAAAEERPCSSYKRKARRQRCRDRRRLRGILVQRVVRADDLWAEGITGQGVTVAILDTGVYEHPDLDGRILHCEDLSNEFIVPTLPEPTISPLPSVSPDLPIDLPTLPAPARAVAEQQVPGVNDCNDTFGHGTFMAGLVAGDGTSSERRFSGAAPDANIVAVKAAGFDGSTDVSKILAGIQWVVAHKDVYGIRVLNLSLGTDSAQDYKISPLNFAVERAWNAGIVVVVSAGNEGPDDNTVMKPGDDPFVITVGSSNDEGTLKVADDMVPVFSSRGVTRSNQLAKPDVVAPGVHTISLRSPGSAVDQNFAEGRRGESYFNGTGTSMSTATVSGLVALMLEAHPELTPDQVKHRLMSTTRTIVETDPKAVGNGLVDAYAATKSSDNGSPQFHDPSSGLGSLELDRGEVKVDVITPLGQIALDGEFVAMVPSELDLLDPDALIPWFSVDYTLTGWDPESWDASTWTTEDWTASTWKASTWKATEWDASTWKWEGTDWTNLDWDASTWKDVDWDASTWKASTWKSSWYAAAWD